MRVVVGTSGTPPVMGAAQIFTILENSDRYDFVSRYLKCFDVDVIKERTPACVIDYDSNSAPCTDSSQVLVAGCSAGYCENVTFEFTKSNAYDA